MAYQAQLKIQYVLPVVHTFNLVSISMDPGTSAERALHVRLGNAASIYHHREALHLSQ